MRALALVTLVSFSAFAADPKPAVDAPTREAQATELNVRICEVDGQTLACMDPDSAIINARGLRAAELERDKCLTRESDAEGFKYRYALLGAGIGVGVTLLAVAIAEGIRAATSKPP